MPVALDELIQSMSIDVTDLEGHADLAALTTSTALTSSPRREGVHFRM
jgi:hypothetical protein